MLSTTKATESREIGRRRNKIDFFNNLAYAAPHFWPLYYAMIYIHRR